MQKSKKIRDLVRGKAARRNTSRRNFLRIERLEDRMVLTGSVPLATNDSYHTLPDEVLEISTPGILANDTDAEGDVLSAVLFSGPTHGSLVLDPAGSFQYSPEAGFLGIDSFMYSAADDTGHSLLAAVTLRVGSGGSPSSQDDSFTVNEDEVLTIPAPAGVLHNDSDPDGDPLTAALVTGPASGTVALAADGSFVYTPAANFHGLDSFVYQASDGISSGNLATVCITVASINDKPVASNDAFSLEEDNSLEIPGPGVMANDSDADGDPLTASLVSGPLHGSLTLSPDGSFSYTPAENFHGVDGFSYLISDGTASSSVATVTLEVNSVNDGPLAANDEYQTAEDTPLAVDAAAGLIANDTDADGNTLVASLVSGPAHGTLELNGDGSFVYTPEANFHGVDGFSYVVSDGTVDSDVASVTLNVSAVNDGPLAVNDEYTIDEDTSLTLPAPGILGNDADPEGDPLAASLVSGPLHGTLSLAADGSVTYTPEANFSGTDGFSYLVNDGAAESAVATVTINVTAVDDPPLAVNDEYTTQEDTPLAIDAAAGLLANDSDPDSTSLAVTMVSEPVHGIVSLNADGSFAYTPSADFSGVDGFSYTLSDGILESDVATVTINVTAVADAPVAMDDPFTTAEDTPLVVDLAGGVLANDSDTDGDSLTAELVSGPAHGALTMNADGSFSFTPEANFNGSDSFVYKAIDGSLASNEATVTITVNPVNDAPAAEGDSFATDEDTPLTISAPGVLANDSDVDGDSLSAVLVTGPAHGTVSLGADGSLTYTPEANFNGSDSFTYRASDGSLESGETTVSIAVNPIPDAPLPHADAFSTGEDVALTVSAGMGLLANDFDPQDLPLTAELVGGPSNGTLTLNADGSFSYIPSANYHGTDSFTYVANNGVEAGPLVTATIVVEPLNDAPSAVNDDYIVDASGSVNADSEAGVLANDADIDGDSLSATLLWGPAHGSLTLNGDGSFSYSADAGYEGTDSFKYQLNDGLANSNVATVTLLVASQGEVPSAPVSQDDAFEIDAGSSLTIDAPGVLENDTDADGDALSAVLASGPSHGALTLNSDGSLSYTPEAGFVGTDSFTYTASDGDAEGNVATVTIDVQDPNQNQFPIAADDGYVAIAETLLSVSADEGVLVNDSAADGDPLSAVLVAGTAHGTVTLNPDGSFDYQPEIGFTGEDSFTYQASDGVGLSEVATVTVNVGSAANHRPVAVNDRFATTVDQPLSVSAPGLLGNDVDPDGDSQTAQLFSGPQNGTVELSSDGSFVYTPSAGFQGRDSFIYRTFDGEVHSALAAVTIYVNPPIGDSPEPVAGGDDSPSPSGCLLDGAVRSVLAGLDEDLLDSLARDQVEGLGDRFDSLLANDLWLL
jgi:large repetitive protein